MKFSKQLSTLLLLGSLVLGLSITSCSKDGTDDKGKSTNNPYVFSLGITADGTTTYYVLDTDDLMSGTISAKGTGIEQSGYHDYQKFNSTILSIGGLGVTDVKGVTRDANGNLQEKGTFVFDNNISEIVQVDDNTLVAIESPARPTAGNTVKIYIVDISSLAITNTATMPISSLVTQSSGADVVWPIATGIGYGNGKIFFSYYESNSTQTSTPWTNEGQIAVIGYPSLTLETIIKDNRTGPIGSWAAHNGIIRDESGNLYLMSSSSIPNGYTQSTKPASFTRIASGSSTFDNSYYFDFSAASGGLRPAHVKYIGNGLVFAEVSTNASPAITDRWGDKNLKCCIIDLNSKTVTDVSGIPVHDGQGGRHYMVIAEDGYVYTSIPTSEGIYIYRVNIATATAEKGAKVSATFVAGFFRLD